MVNLDKLRKAVAEQFGIHQSAIETSMNLQKEIEIDTSLTRYTDSTKEKYSFRDWKKYHGWDNENGKLVDFDSKETFYINSDPGTTVRRDGGYKGQSRKLHDVEGIENYPVLICYEQTFKQDVEANKVTLYKNPLYQEGYEQFIASRDQRWADRLI